VNPAPPTIVDVSRVAFVVGLFAVALVPLGFGRHVSRAQVVRGLVPEGAQLLGQWNIAAGAGMGRQVLVEWQRGRNADPPQNTYALALWQSKQPHWRRLFQIRLFPGDGQVVRVRQADVTRHGHLDQVVTGPTQGSGDCGPRRVLATIDRRVQQIVRLPSLTCDTEVSGARGRVVVSRGTYTAHDSHCCPTFTLVQTLRWDGARLRRAGSALFWNCTVHVCWRQPLHFAARASAFWDSRRGVAVGGARPWLIAITRDGGRRWRIVDAAPVPLGRPQRQGRGRARIRFLRCRRFCHGARFAVTSSYGLAWHEAPRTSFIWPG
jgi:hypothetical protein